MEYILAVSLFAISSSITPGPNNIMVMTSTVNFGIKRSLPLLTGICVGFTVMLLLVGLGFAQLFTLFPELHLIIKCIGIAYLLYLAWMIANSSSDISTNADVKPLTFMNGALFQWINAKAWIVATGAIATFSTAGEDLSYQFIVIALAFFVVSFPCVGVWMIFGNILRDLLKNKAHRAWFNYTMATLLIASVIPVISEVLRQVL
ncbi:LysE family translocator [Thalassotalea fusca]